MKKSVLYGLFLLCGIALMALSLVLEGRISDSVGGTMMGVGAGALGYCGSNLLDDIKAQFPVELAEARKIVSARNEYVAAAKREAEDIRKRAEIEAKDERNVAIRRRAQAVSGEVLQWAVMGAAFVSIGLDAPLWVTLAAVGVFLAKCVLELWLMVRYQREM